MSVVELDSSRAFCKFFPVHAAIIRGTTANEQGKISMEQEGPFPIMLYLAMAAKNCGGKI